MLLSEMPLAASTAIYIAELTLDGKHSALRLPVSLENQFFEDPATMRRFAARYQFREVDGILMDEVTGTGHGIGQYWVSSEHLRASKTLAEITLEKL
jgi:hypothetical protein